MNIKLDKEDQKYLKNEIKQVFFVQILILFAVSIFYFFGFIIIDSLNGIEKNKYLYQIIFFLIIFSIYGLNILILLRPLFKDLMAGEKKVLIGKIIKKGTNTRYGWHANPVLDSLKQPVLIEYYFIVENTKYWVNESFYSQFNEEDIIAIHTSIDSNKILQITSDQ